MNDRITRTERVIRYTVYKGGAYLRSNAAKEASGTAKGTYWSMLLLFPWSE